jgi:hypothetical protein
VQLYRNSASAATRLAGSQNGVQNEINRVANAEPEPICGSTLDVLYVQTFGFVVLRHFFGALLIASEIDRVMYDGRPSSFEASGGAEIHF